LTVHVAGIAGEGAADLGSQTGAGSACRSTGDGRGILRKSEGTDGQGDDDCSVPHGDYLNRDRGVGEGVLDRREGCNVADLVLIVINECEMRESVKNEVKNKCQSECVEVVEVEWKSGVQQSQIYCMLQPSIE
jgi:hypothetical protein